MAKQCALISTGKRLGHLPDYGGQFLSAIAESLIEALVFADLELLNDLYPAYFLSCLVRFEDLRPKTLAAEWRIRQELLVAATPVLDLMEISGYFCLYAEFHNQPEIWYW